jgi:hypothetical protein
VDAACSDPVVSDLKEDSDGYFATQVPHGFDGYFIFTAPGYVSGLWYYGRPVFDDTTVSGPLMITPATLDQLASIAGAPNDADHGAALVEVWDCDDHAAEGVVFDELAEQQAFYFDGALPARNQHATAVSTALSPNRESVAAGGYSFLTPSSSDTFIAELDSAHTVIGTRPAQVRAAHITYVRIYAGSGVTR